MNKRPYVTLSCATSLDGYLDDASSTRLLLSNEEDFDRVDGVRARQDAILVGSNTIRRDNPRLLIKSTNRRAARATRGLPEDPVKITITTSGDLDPNASFFTTGAADKIVYASSPAALPERLAATVVPTGGEVDLGWLLEDLAGRGIGRLLVEGGGSILSQFLASGLFDELQLAIAPVLVGDDRAPRFIRRDRVAGPIHDRLQLTEVRRLGEIALLRYVTAGALEHALSRILAPARAVLLDFDGPVTPLLADGRDRGVADRMRGVLTKRQIEPPDAIRRTRDPLAILRWATSRRLGVEIARSVQEDCVRGEIDAARIAEPTRDVDRLLAECRTAELPVIIVSNNSAEAIETFLDRYDLAGLITGIVARVPDRPDLMKPSPDPVRRALQRLGRAATECVLIGDSVTDIEVCLTTGVSGIGFARNDHRRAELEDAGAEVIVDDHTATISAMSAEIR